MSYIQKKALVVGDGACGKTCLLTVYVTNEFPTEYVPTVFDSHSKDMDIDDNHFTLTILDTSGQEDYERLRDLLYVHSDVFVLCFAVDSRTSFQNIQAKWIKEIKYFRLPIVLVGTKTDLRSEEDCVKKEEAEIVAKRIKAVAYLECSSKLNEGVQEVFQVAAQAAWNYKDKARRCTVL